MKYIKRLLYVPQGFIEGIFDFFNNHARDVENRKRFPYAIIDKNSSFSLDTSIGKGSHIFGGSIINNCKIGDYSYISRNTLIQNTSIGNYCSISHEVNIGLGQHPVHLFSTSPLFYKKRNPLKTKIIKFDYSFDEYKPIIIGHDVWIGAKVIVMDGVTIGTGAIIAAGAVVTKDVDPYSIVGGIPAKIIKMRFDEHKISQLLKSQWWLLEPQKAYIKMNSFTK